MSQPTGDDPYGKGEGQSLSWTVGSFGNVSGDTAEDFWGDTYWRDAWGNWQKGNAPPGAQTYSQTQHGKTDKQMQNDPTAATALGNEQEGAAKFQQAYATGDPAAWNPNIPGQSGPGTLFPNSDIFGIGLSSEKGKLGGSPVFLTNNPAASSHLPKDERAGFGISGTDGNGLMQQLVGWSVGSDSDKAKFKAYQKQLYSLGLYGNAKPQYGVWNAQTDRAAVENALLGYQQMATGYQTAGKGVLTWDEYLKIAKKQGMSVGGSGPQRAPLNMTDPAQLQQTLQAAAQNALGRNLSSKELAHFVTAFHGKEQSAYDAAGAGKTYTNPDVAGEAMNYVDQHNTTEVAQNRTVGYVDAINQLLGVK
jgi:hypothetical protein